LLRPRGVYALYPATHHTAHSLTLSDIRIEGNVGEFLAGATRIAAFIVTVGPEISERAQSASKKGDALSAWVMDAIGSWAAEGAADALMLQIRRHLDDKEDLTLRYSPGYCGMGLIQQQNLFGLVDARSVGVRLLPTLLMHPLKSISGLVGLAPKEVVARHRSPCDLCPRTGCHMRRAS
jgi:cobalamin-dependent methionine synthase I